MLAERRQLEVLAAIGIDVYRLRARPDAADSSSAASAPLTASASASVADPARAAELVIACESDQRRHARVVQVLRALGRSVAEATWVDPGADAPAGSVPAAPAYLLIGAAARACSAQLPLNTQEAAAIAVIADPAALPRDAAGKRALWQALKPLARRLRRAAE